MFSHEVRLPRRDEGGDLDIVDLFPLAGLEAVNRLPTRLYVDNRFPLTIAAVVGVAGVAAITASS